MTPVTSYTLLAEEAATAPVTGTKTDAAPANGAKDGQPPSMFSSFLIPMLLMLAVLYFILWRPQRKKQQDEKKRHAEMLANLTKNDHVLVSGGIYGVVVSVGPESVTVKIDEKNDVRIRFAREAVLRVVGEGEEGAGGDPAKA
jgi:preprotein translocase subunit YajC